MAKPAIYIQEPWGSGARSLFHSRGFPLVSSPEQCDIIVFNGGEDISPRLYGEEALRGTGTWWNDDRDAIELAGYERAKDKFKFGICRGGQLLNVLNGGRLWQDVNNHSRAHPMLDIHTGKTIMASSIHHQQFILGPDALLVATSREATHKIGNMDGKRVEWKASTGELPEFSVDPEVVYYPKDRALCIQGHPEYGGYPDMTAYCLSLIERFY